MLRRSQPGHAGRADRGDLRLQPLLQLRAHGAWLDARLRDRDRATRHRRVAARRQQPAGARHPVAVCAALAPRAGAVSDAATDAFTLGLAQRRALAATVDIAHVLPRPVAVAGTNAVHEPQPDSQPDSQPYSERDTDTHAVAQHVAIAIAEPGTESITVTQPQPQPILQALTAG